MQQRKPDGLISIGEVIGGLDGPVKKALQPSPQALHDFTQLDQVNQLVGASEADPDLGFMARLMALCSLPRTNPGNRLQYKRRNGPYKLVMIAGADNKLPYGNLPRLLLAWVCTEAVRTQNRIFLTFLGKPRQTYGEPWNSAGCMPHRGRRESKHEEANARLVRDRRRNRSVLWDSRVHH